MCMRPVPPAPDPTLYVRRNQCHSISQAAALCNQVGNVYVHFPSLSGPEGPMNQADKPKRFLLPLPTRLKVAGRQDNYSLSCQPWRPQAPSQGGAVVDPEGSLTAHRAVIVS